MCATQARAVGPRRCCTYVLKVYRAAHGNFGTQDEQHCFKPGTSLGSISRAHMHLAFVPNDGLVLVRVYTWSASAADIMKAIVPQGYHLVRAQPLSPRSSATTVTRACRLVLMHACTSVRSIPAILASTSTSPNTLRELRGACRGRSEPQLAMWCGYNGNYVSPSPHVHLRNALDKLYRPRRWPHVYVIRVAAAACAARARGMPRSQRTWRQGPAKLAQNREANLGWHVCRVN